MRPSEEPRCYACGGPISTSDSALWDIQVIFRNAAESLCSYTFVVADDCHMAIGYLNGMYHRGFFARTEPDGSHMQVIPVSRVVEIIVTPAGGPHAA
jgi:hypothetical protein